MYMYVGLEVGQRWTSNAELMNLDTAITAMSALMIVMLVPSGLVGHVTGRRAAILATDEFSKPLADGIAVSWAGYDRLTCGVQTMTYRFSRCL